MSKTIKVEATRETASLSRCGPPTLLPASTGGGSGGRMAIAGAPPCTETGGGSGDRHGLQEVELVQGPDLLKSGGVGAPSRWMAHRLNPPCAARNVARGGLGGALKSVVSEPDHRLTPPSGAVLRKIASPAAAVAASGIREPAVESMPLAA